MSTSAPPYQTHRRDTPSVSSVLGPKSERSTRSSTHPAVESAVTRLLVSIKELLEALTKWSQQEVTDLHVSDVYVRLGNDFNAAVAAFAAFRIDMTELMSVPEDLRSVLETCLAEDARPENLDRYLPDVRKIITGLLHGLREKQSLYRRNISEHRHHRSESAGHSRESKSSSRSSAERTRRETSASQKIMNARHNGEQTRISDSQSLRKAATTSSRRLDPNFAQSGSTPPRPPLVEDEDLFVGGFVQPDTQKIPSESSFAHVDRTSTPPPRHTPPYNGYPPSSPDESAGSKASVNGKSKSSPGSPAPNLPQVPADVKRYSLVDKPLIIPSVVIDDASSPHQEGRRMQDNMVSPSVEFISSPIEHPSMEPPSTPAIASSLAALKKSDALERRASKRFSTYNILKMTGSNPRSGTTSGTNRRSMAVSNALTVGELAVLTEADEEGPVTPRKREKMTRRVYVPTSIPEQEDITQIPPLPSKEKQKGGVSDPESQVEDQVMSSSTSTHTAPPDKPFPVFLQVGRDVKKAMIEPNLTLSTLRMLFVDKFSYSPRLENFPSIYIRDASSGVQYELEDVDEVRGKCLLSLNIEPLDQIKQHIDSQISTLSQDIKDLRSIVVNSRASHPSAPIVAQPFEENVSLASARPTEKQLQRAAGRLSKIWMEGDKPSDLDPAASGTSSTPATTQSTAQAMQSQGTGGSVVQSDFSNRIVGDLRTQYDEVQNLRRDLGVMRQLYTEFMNQTKDSLGTLRGQTRSVRQLATTKVAGARAYIQDGKSKLDTRSQNILTKMEELQDTVEGVKDDVIRRQITPKPHVLKAVKEDIQSLSDELESLKEHIQNVKPMWKKTWEEELQLIVEEQQFLSHQEEFLNDLQDDHKAVVEICGHVEKVILLRGTGASRGVRARLKPVPAEEGTGTITTVMAEIRGAAVDPDRRLKAIAANQKNREREIANKSDAFQSELAGFVTSKKLKMTGGADEVERVRQKRNDQTLKAMFTKPSPASNAAVLESPTDTKPPDLPQ